MMVNFDMTLCTAPPTSPNSVSNSLYCSGTRMGVREGGKDSLVVVSYDFEYTTEEGKRVWMKEGEVLLLLARTNNDWWQVGPFIFILLSTISGSDIRFQQAVLRRISCFHQYYGVY